MENKKMEFHFFTITEWKKEEEYLREQQKKGWKFVNVSLPGFYTFESCEPEDVIYQLDYNQDGLKHHREYVQMFEDCGWEYVMDFVGYSYFRKPVTEMVEDEEIFCDDESRLDMIRRVYKGRVIPLIVIFCCCIVPQLFIQMSQHRAINQMFVCMFSILFVVYLILFIQFGYQYFKLKKRLGR